MRPPPGARTRFAARLRIAPRRRVVLGPRRRPKYNAGKEVPVTASTEFEQKHARVAQWLRDTETEGIVVRAAANVAWLASGGEVLRPASSPVFVLTADRALLLCATEDADRLRQEEVRGVPVEVVPVLSVAPDALTDRVHALLPDAKRWRCDSGGGEWEPAPGFDALRGALLPDEVDRAGRLGRDAAAAVEEVAAECYRGIGERDAAARLVAECTRRGLRVRDLVCGADDRFENYGRPAPKSGIAERALVMGVVVSRSGLHVAVTRTVCLAAPSETFLQRFAGGCEWAARLRHFSRAGETLGAAIQKALPQPPLHLGSLGGVCGYALFEHEARASSGWRLASHQMLVWTVSTSGMRIEDTLLGGPDGFVPVTSTENWPRRTIRVDGASYDVPDLLMI